MEAVYKRDLNGTYLIMETQGIREKDYQMYMLEANDIEGLIPVQMQGVSQMTQYYYDISGKVPVKAMYERGGIKGSEICQLVFQILSLAREVREYLLDENKILLEPEYIFYENGKFFFCYYPLHGGSLHEAFRHLADYLVRQVACEDKEGICIAYELHKETLEENYCLDQIAERILKGPKSRTAEQECNSKSIEEDLPDDPVTEQELGHGLIRETRKKWKGVHGLFRKKQENIWGEFDDFYVEEEKWL